MSLFDDAITAVEATRTEYNRVVDELNVATFNLETATSSLATATARIAALEAELAECQEPPAPDVDATVPPGASASQINTILQAQPEGARIGFSGVYELGGLLRPKAGQTLLGPARFNCGRRFDALFNLGTAQIPNITFEDLEMHSTRKWAIQAYRGTTVKRCKFSDHGWNAIRSNTKSAFPVNILLEDSEFMKCGWDPAALGHGAAGVKFFETGGTTPGSGVTIRRCKANDNIGNGIWFDHECRGDLVEDNECISNSRKGIFYEVSTGPVLIQRNVSRDNGQTGFQTTNTPRGRVLNNTFGGNGVGIAILEVDRTDHGAPFEDWQVQDNVMNGDSIRVTAPADTVTQSNNT